MDNEPWIELHATDGVATESSGQSDGGMIRFLASHAPTQDVTMSYQVLTDGYPATQGLDYTSLGTVTLRAGQQFVDVPITPVNDDDPEWTEDVRVRLQESTTYNKGVFDAADVMIVDDDGCDLILQGLSEETDPEPNEISPGALMLLGDEYADLPPAEAANIVAPTDYKQGATLILTLTGSGVAVYATADATGTPLLGSTNPSKTWVMGQESFPESVFVQAVEPGAFTLVLQTTDASASPPPTQPTTTQDSVKGHVGRVDLTMPGSNEQTEDTTGVVVNLNADNDNGSAMVNGVPTVRDFQIGPNDPPEKRENEQGEMANLNIFLPAPAANEVKKVRLKWDSDKVRVWKTATKDEAAIASGVEWTLGQQPPRVMIEGVSLSAARAEITFTLELLGADGAVLKDDAVKVAVGPILTGLSVTPGAGTAPGLRNGRLESDAPNGTPEAGNFSAEAFAAGGGRLVFVQNVHIKNNLANGAGADLGARQFRTVDFAGQNAGQWLLDLAAGDNRPVYGENYQAHRVAGSPEVSAKATDSPRLDLTGITPGQNQMTSLDVTYEFRLHAAWQYGDGALYFLGKTTWNVRFQGTLTNAGNLAFQAGNDNRNNGSGSWDKTDEVPIVDGIIANQAGSAWR